LKGDNIIETLNQFDIDRNSLKRIIAVEIKKARMSAGLTQEAVLRETGIHVGRIEMGKSSIDVCTFLKLCIFLDADIQRIICKIVADSVKLTVM